MIDERLAEIRARFKNNWCPKGECYCDDPYDAMRYMNGRLSKALARLDAVTKERDEALHAEDVAEQYREDAEARAEALAQALEWIQEFAAKTNKVGVAQPGFTHIERRARAALDARRKNV